MKEPGLAAMGKLVAVLTVAAVIMSAVAEEDAAVATQQKVRNTYWVFESFEDNAAQEWQPAPACRMAQSRNLVPK